MGLGNFHIHGDFSMAAVVLPISGGALADIVEVIKLTIDWEAE